MTHDDTTKNKFKTCFEERNADLSFLGQYPKDKKDLLQGPGVQEAHSAQSHPVRRSPSMLSELLVLTIFQRYKAGKASLFAQGKRRYDRKQSGYG